MDSALNTVVGWCDGYQRGHVRGWAWFPRQPHETVTVQLLVDGVLLAEAAACVARPDLKTAGIGHGRHAFAIPFTVPAHAPEALHVTIRAKDGPILNHGQFDIRITPEDQATLARRRSQAHLESVFGPLATDAPPPPPAAVALPRPNFILYCAAGTGALAEKLGTNDYSYAFVMRGFRDVLRPMGTLHVVTDPAREVDPIYRAAQHRGEECIFLSFAPPHATTLGLACPTIPVIAWEFGTIPTQAWDGEPRHDWRRVLRQCGRAIAISGFGADVIRRTMGAPFPVAGIPTPVWDRLAGLRARIAEVPPEAGAHIEFDGFVWDSRTAAFSLGMSLPPIPTLPPGPNPARLPLRDWRMRLAEASRTLQAEADHHAAQEAAEAARQAEQAAEAERQAAAEALAKAHEAEHGALQAEADRLAAALRALEHATQAEAAAREAERRQAEDAARAEAARVKSLRERAGLTRRMALHWYRDIVRDALPRPVAATLSRAGRLAGQTRRALATPHAPVTQPTPPTESEPPPAVGRGAPHPIATPTPPPAIEPPQAPEPPPEPAALEPAAPESPPPQIIPDGLPLPEPTLAVFDPDPFPESPATNTSPKAEVSLDGVVFTSVLAPKDGRKNWQDILSAFVFAFQHTPNATLVLKMIGADPAFWWWEFHDIITRLPQFDCRVVVLHGYLNDPAYEQLIEATHIVVNASLAEGQCLPLVEFLSGQRPAIAPDHTAMADYITPENAIIVRGEVEYCSWPHNPHNDLIATRMRMDWSSLRDAYAQAYRIVTTDPPRYAAMRQAAATSMQAYCGDQTVRAALEKILYLRATDAPPGPEMAA